MFREAWFQFRMFRMYIFPILFLCILSIVVVYFELENLRGTREAYNYPYDHKYFRKEDGPVFRAADAEERKQLWFSESYADVDGSSTTVASAIKNVTELIVEHASKTEAEASLVIPGE